MKKIILYLVFISLSNIVVAQDESYNGPAGNSVKKFWDNAKSITELLDKGVTGSMITSRMTPLERSFNETKTKDPGYNIANMQAALNKIKERINEIIKTQSAAKESEKENEELEATLNEKKNILFGDGVKFAVVWTDLPTIQEKIILYKQIVSEGIALHKKLNLSSPKKESLSDYEIDDIEFEFKGADEKWQKLITKSKEANDVRGVQCCYYELLLWQAYWNAASQIYSDKPEFLVKYNKVSDIIKDFGTPEEMASMAANKKADEIKNRRIPEAVMKDAALEKMFMDVFNKRYKEEFKGTAIKAVILQSEWHTKRNEITGIITGRTREGAIVYKGTDGKCYLIKSYFIHQEYIGGSFKNPSSIYVVHGGLEMLCENVK